MKIVLWWASNFAALWVAARLVDGITYGSLGWLAVAALVFGVVNLVVRPLLVLLALPAVILTLGVALLLPLGKLSAVLLPILAGYLYLAMRHFYGASRLRTGARAAVVLFGYGLTLSCAIAAVAMATIYFGG